MRTENLAKIAVAFSGVAWGLFWIPLRGLNGAGIDAFWSFVTFNALPALILLPLFLARLRQQRAGGFWLFATGLAMGLTQFFYSLSVLHTEIVRAMILFYFNPVWATIMARIFLGESITPIRWLAIAIAFSGMFIILGIDQGLPWPRNLGDWAAVVAGVAWASSIVLLRRHQGQKPLDLFIQNFMWTGAMLLLLLAFAGTGGAPPLGLVVSQLWWLLPFILFIAMVGRLHFHVGRPPPRPGHRRRPLHDGNQCCRDKLGPVVRRALRPAGNLGNCPDHSCRRTGKRARFVARTTSGATLTLSGN